MSETMSQLLRRFKRDRKNLGFIIKNIKDRSSEFRTSEFLFANDPDLDGKVVVLRNESTK